MGALPVQNEATTERVLENLLLAGPPTPARSWKQCPSPKRAGQFWGSRHFPIPGGFVKPPPQAPSMQVSSAVLTVPQGQRGPP